MDKALLIGVELKESKYDINYSLDELQNLANACDIKAIDRVIQQLDKINPKYYIGSGKVLEIKEYLANTDINILIFNDELSPAQIRNLEDILDIKIIDRTLLVLDIFRKRANTQEAILEVKLAQLKYLLPRLQGLNASLSRQGGSNFSAKGPGEKQIELDRRKIFTEIIAVEEKLKKCTFNRETQRAKRKKGDIPVVSLVGYTNAGKSSTMNSLLKLCHISSDKEVLEKDMLFATLNTSARKIKLPNNLQIILTDTVGFISNLPHHLINSFRATLEEIIASDLIIHVVDISNPRYLEDMMVTNQMLESLGCQDIPKIILYNKVDLLEKEPIWIGDGITYSNKTNKNQDKLLDIISDKLIDKSTTEMSIEIPYTNGQLISLIDGFGIIKVKIMMQNGIYYKANIPNYLVKYFDSITNKKELS